MDIQTWHWYNIIKRLKIEHARFKRMRDAGKNRKHWEFVNQTPATKPEKIVRRWQ